MLECSVAWQHPRPRSSSASILFIPTMQAFSGLAVFLLILSFVNFPMENLCICNFLRLSQGHHLQTIHYAAHHRHAAPPRPRQKKYISNVFDLRKALSSLRRLSSFSRSETLATSDFTVFAIAMSCSWRVRRLSNSCQIQKWEISQNKCYLYILQKHSTLMLSSTCRHADLEYYAV